MRGDVTLADGTAVESKLVVSATDVRPDSRLAAAPGLDIEDGRIVVDGHMHASVPNVYAAGDVALAAGYPAAWTTVPQYSCFIGNYTLRYRGWGTDFEAAWKTTATGFTVAHRSDDRVVGALTATANRDA